MPLSPPVPVFVASARFGNPSLCAGLAGFPVRPAQREGFPNRADATKTGAGGDRGMCEV